ncbi:MAG: hypothetical protein MJ075_00775 [Oscillospiraceae bacterium]|nr:hypothetical protein [Oscillospiraceae bacterium]
MKRLILVLMLLSLLPGLLGCESVLDGEVSVIQPYAVGNSQPAMDYPEETLILNTDDEFRAAVENMIANGEASAAFRIPLSEDMENRETELEEYCQSIALSSPLGSYAVYYITCKLTPIVSYYTCNVTITYKRSTESLQNITRISSARFFESRLLSALSGYEDSLTFQTSVDSLTTDYIISEIERLSQEHPLMIVMPPDAGITNYPSSTGTRITEIDFQWSYTRLVLSDMQNRLLNNVDDIISRSEDTGDYGLLTSFYGAFQNITLLQEPINPLSNTAYGVLVGKAGTSLGFALGFKALCDRLGMDCKIIDGWLDGKEHYWNLVNCDGSWYHIDSSENTADILLFGDNSMQGRYFWATEEYPSCPTDYSPRLNSQSDFVLPEE